MANGTAIEYNYLTTNSTAIINITSLEDDTIVISDRNDLLINGHKALDVVCLDNPGERYCMS